MAVQGSSYNHSRAKDSFDDLVSTGLTIVTAPIEISARRYLQRKLGESSALYRQERHGRLGEFFTIEKLKTMYDSDNEDSDKRSPRIISDWAQLIRDCGIDELPQLRQVGTGKPMSMVGPRSMTEAYLDIYESVGDSAIFNDWWTLITDLKSGVTGPGQLEGVQTDRRDKHAVNSIMLADLGYYPRATLLGDAATVLNTPSSLLLGYFRKKRQRDSPSIA